MLFNQGLLWHLNHLFNLFCPQNIQPDLHDFLRLLGFRDVCCTIFICSIDAVNYSIQRDIYMISYSANQSGHFPYQSARGKCRTHWLHRAIGKLPEIFGTLPIVPHLTLTSLEMVPVRPMVLAWQPVTNLTYFQKVCKQYMDVGKYYTLCEIYNLVSVLLKSWQW